MRRVLITGAGGTIGAALAHRVAASGPELLVLANHSELALHTIESELRASFPALGQVCVLVDIRNADAVRRMIDTHRPDTILHAAAVKHVPVAEANPIEAITTNVIGTRNVVVARGAARFVLISTDKAVHPTSVMGATKRAAERVTQVHGGIVVRFGNVCESSGSVVPLFRQQIARGGPVTVTHPEVERFFMSIDAAAELVLFAAKSGTPGEVYVSGRYNRVRIADLARQMIAAAGRDIDIVFSGLRQGEKLREELHYDDESPTDAGHGITRGRLSPADVTDVDARLERVRKCCAKLKSGQALLELLDLVPECDLAIFKRSLQV